MNRNASEFVPVPASYQNNRRTLVQPQPVLVQPAFPQPMQATVPVMVNGVVYPALPRPLPFQAVQHMYVPVQRGLGSPQPRPIMPIFQPQIPGTGMHHPNLPMQQVPRKRKMFVQLSAPNGKQCKLCKAKLPTKKCKKHNVYQLRGQDAYICGLCKNRKNLIVADYRPKIDKLLSEKPINKRELFRELREIREKDGSAWKDFIATYEYLKEFMQTDYLNFIKLELENDLVTIVEFEKEMGDATIMFLQKIQATMEESLLPESKSRWSVEDETEEVNMKWGRRETQPAVLRSVSPQKQDVESEPPQRIRRAPGILVKVDYGDEGKFDAIMVEDHGDGTYDVQYLDESFPAETVEEGDIIFAAPKLKQPQNIDEIRDAYGDASAHPPKHEEPGSSRRRRRRVNDDLSSASSPNHSEPGARGEPGSSRRRRKINDVASSDSRASSGARDQREPSPKSPRRDPPEPVYRVADLVQAPFEGEYYDCKILKIVDKEAKIEWTDFVDDPMWIDFAHLKPSSKAKECTSEDRESRSYDQPGSSRRSRRLENGRLDLPYVSPPKAPEPGSSRRKEERLDLPSVSPPPVPPSRKRTAQRGREDLPSDDDTSSSDEEEIEFDRHSIQRRIEVLTHLNGQSLFTMNDLRRLCMLSFLQKFDEEKFRDELGILVQRKILSDFEILEFHESKEYEAKRKRKPPTDVLNSCQNDKVHHEANMFWLNIDKQLFWNIEALTQCLRDDQLCHICGIFDLLKQKLTKCGLEKISQFVERVQSGSLGREFMKEIKNKKLLKLLARKIMKAHDVLELLRETSDQDKKLGKVKGIITEIRTDEYKEVKDGVDVLYVRMLKKREYVEIPCKFLNPKTGLVMKYALQKDKKSSYDNLSFDEKGQKWITVPMSFKDKRLELKIPPVFPTLEDCVLQNEVQATIHVGKKGFKKKKKQKWKKKR